MDAALQRRVQRYGWDKAATHYETYWQEQLKPAQEKLLKMAQLKPGEKVIDIACGTGLVSFPAAKLVGANGSVLGTDISDKMVDHAKKLASESGFNNIQFERMDAEELLSIDSNYDVALCALGLMYVPDPLTALKEMKRVLKTAGRAIAAVWGQRSNCGWAEIFEIVDRRVSSEVCPMFFNLGNPDMLQKHFEAAGFTDIVTVRLQTELIYESAEEACGAAFAGGPVALAYHKFNNEVKEEVHKEYLDSIAAFKNNEGYKVPGEFVVTIGRK